MEGGLTALERVFDGGQKVDDGTSGETPRTFLCRGVASSTDAHRRDEASRLFAKIDAGVALPRLRAALSALKQTSRRPSRPASAWPSQEATTPTAHSPSSASV